MNTNKKFTTLPMDEKEKALALDVAKLFENHRISATMAFSIAKLFLETYNNNEKAVKAKIVFENTKR